MRLVVQFAGVLDRQHMPPCRNRPRSGVGIGEQRLRCHFVIGEPAAKLNFPRPGSRQSPQTHGLLRYHALEQNRTVFFKRASPKSPTS